MNKEYDYNKCPNCFKSITPINMGMKRARPLYACPKCGVLFIEREKGHKGER